MDSYEKAAKLTYSSAKRQETMFPSGVKTLLSVCMHIHGSLAADVLLQNGGVGIPASPLARSRMREQAEVSEGPPYDSRK